MTEYYSRKVIPPVRDTWNKVIFSVYVLAHISTANGDKHQEVAECISTKDTTLWRLKSGDAIEPYNLIAWSHLPDFPEEVSE